MSAAVRKKALPGIQPVRAAPGRPGGDDFARFAVGVLQRSVHARLLWLCIPSIRGMVWRGCGETWIDGGEKNKLQSAQRDAEIQSQGRGNVGATHWVARILYASFPPTRRGGPRGVNGRLSETPLRLDGGQTGVSVRRPYGWTGANGRLSETSLRLDGGQTGVSARRPYTPRSLRSL